MNWLIKRIFASYIRHVEMLLSDSKERGSNEILHPFCYLSPIKFSLVNIALKTSGFKVKKVKGRFLWNKNVFIDKYYISLR